MTAEQAPLIAIVNADRGLVELLEMLLSLEGFRIVAAQPEAVKDGAEALIGFLAEHDPDVVLFDVPYPYHGVMADLPAGAAGRGVARRRVRADDDERAGRAAAGRTSGARDRRTAV